MESFYVEGLLDYQDLALDLALRLDSFNAGTTYPSIFGDQYSPRITPERKTEVAPRFIVAHSISDRARIRGGYEIGHQLPQFNNLYQMIHRDYYEGNTAFFGTPDLQFQKTTAFEIGFTSLLLEDWLLDIAAYDQEFERSVAARYVQPVGSTYYLRAYTNDGNGHVRGMDTTLRKRFSDMFSLDLAYSLLFSRSTDSDPEDFVENQGVWISGDYPPPPHDEEVPADFQQTHTLDTQFI